MRWVWPFNGRANNGQHKNGNGSGADGARPDFLCVGVHKGGTTWLYQQLDSHPDFNRWARMEKLLLTDKVRSHLAQFFKRELKSCAARLGGPARDWPARYGFSLLLFVWDLMDDSIDLFFWLDWIS